MYATEVNGINIKNPGSTPIAGTVPVLQSDGKTAIWTAGGGGGGNANLNFLPPVTSISAAISGNFNGTNKTFTLPSTPPNPSNLMLFLNGVFQIQGTDYTLAGRTITMTVAPDSASNLLAL